MFYLLLYLIVSIYKWFSQLFYGTKSWRNTVNWIVELNWKFIVCALALPAHCTLSLLYFLLVHCTPCQFLYSGTGYCTFHQFIVLSTSLLYSSPVYCTLQPVYWTLHHVIVLSISSLYSLQSYCTFHQFIVLSTSLLHSPPVYCNLQQPVYCNLHQFIVLSTSLLNSPTGHYTLH